MSSTRPHVFFALLRLHQRVNERVAEVLVPIGLTPAQYACLSLVRAPLSQTSADLARRLGISAQSSGETVAALNRMGLVTRAQKPGDSKRKYLALTAAGQDRLAEADRLVDRAERLFLDALDPGEAERFVATVQRLRAGQARTG